jgi:hypothetical protein
MKKAYTLPPIPYTVKKYNYQNCTWVDIIVKFVWNNFHFGITRDEMKGQLLALIHLPTQKVVNYGKIRRLKSVAQELDNLPITAFNLDKLAPNQKKDILNYIQKRVSE